MSPLAVFLIAIWLSSATAEESSFLSNAADTVIDNVNALLIPVEKTVIGVASSQCELAKKILGINKAYDDDNKPDLSKLTITFTSGNTTLTYNLTDAGVEIPRSQWFNPQRPLHIYFHGFTDNPSKSSFQNISIAYRSRGDYNIVALDASSQIGSRYLRSSDMVRFIGEALGQFIVELFNIGFNPDAIHLIGHSLGSHIAGFAGKTFRNLTGLRVGRISGLDPAGPCFTDLNEMRHLDVNDAVFVDIIHTDMGVLGMDKQLGHVDFYPNGGSGQLKCNTNSCSHSRAWEFFGESIVNSTAFLAVKADSWNDFKKGDVDFNDTLLMGIDCPGNARGRYYLQTDEDYPFGKGVEGLNYINNEPILERLLG